MPNFTSVLREEITRLAKRQVRRETGTTRRLSARHRRDIAELKRQVQDMTQRLAFLEKQERRRVAQSPAPAETEGNSRFSPKWLKAHRRKVGLSAADYAKLVGVSPLTIYKWEQGEFKPREQQVAALAAVRTLRKREALKRLEMLG